MLKSVAIVLEKGVFIKGINVITKKQASLFHFFDDEERFVKGCDTK